ncbi:hypothetical protein ACSBOB_00830 [Mesorhizobium sp. ASY16-5R]|uniref:hypothetical protein n=1 Tax=Mesorhizobium sp. ASY16-5R TaxID=3445772 RepID=UPI003F9FD7F9
MLSRRAMITGIALTGMAVIGDARAAMTATLLPFEKEDLAAYVMRRRAALPPMERAFFDQNLYAYFEGRPHAFDPNAADPRKHYRQQYEEWVSGFTPECVEWVNAGSPREWGGRDLSKIRVSRKPRRKLGKAVLS